VTTSLRQLSGDRLFVTDGGLETELIFHDGLELPHFAAFYFMVNCAHPTHFAPALEPGRAWMRRIAGLRANASTRSHAELDEASELDEGDPEDLGARHGPLHAMLPWVTVLGGCCGTDARHVAAICAGWLGAAN
jgi:S-methylmethionine-dependent homocysteine/selenocysteine methylase